MDLRQGYGDVMVDDVSDWKLYSIVCLFKYMEMEYMEMEIGTNALFITLKFK